MNNLFKRSAASFALVGALTSSLFGGNAAYIDIRVKYLSGSDSAVLGYESWNDTKSTFKAGAKKDLVELYIRVLDENGDFADKSYDGIALQPIVAKRIGNNNKNLQQPLMIGVGDSDVVGMGNLLEGNALSEANNTITRAVIEPVNNKNSARYTLDYTDYTAVELMDHLTITAGKMDKNVDIKLSTGKASGLLARITRKSKYDSDATLELNNGRYINSFFTNIKLLGEPRAGAGGNLSVASDDVPQITAGESIPFRIYASTGNARGYAGNNVENSTNFPHNGRFTVASELNDAEIVVIAVGDYGDDNMAETYLNKITVKMKDGVAFGEIPIMYGLPEKNSSNGATGDASFDDRIPAISEQTYGGLGVRLIAYVKDNMEVSNSSVLRINGSGQIMTNTLTQSDHNSTDSIKIRSDVFAGFKVGTFNTAPSNNVAANLWTATSTDVFVSNSQGVASADTLYTERNGTKNIVAVDKLGNPTGSSRAILGADGSFTFKVAGIAQAGNIRTGVDFNISADNAMVTGAGIGLTEGTITISDGEFNASVDKTISILYSGGLLSGKDPIVLKAHGLDLVGKTTSDVVGRLTPLIQSVTVTNGGTTKLYTEQKKTKEYTNMEVSIKVHEVDDGNVTLHLSVLKVEDGAFNSAIQFVSGATTTAAAALNLKTKLGAYVLDINNTAGTNRIVTMRDATGIIGVITFAPVTTTNYANLVGTTTKLSFKGSTKVDNSNVAIYRNNVDLYVATTTTTPNAESFVGKDSEPGLLGKTQIDFDFSGEFIDKYSGKTRATITFAGEDISGNDKDDGIKAGVLGVSSDGVGTIEGPAPISKTVKNVLIPASGRVSVVLYGGYPTASNSLKNKDANKTRYHIESVTVNGFAVVKTSRHKNELTEAIDIDMIEDKNVTVEAGGVSAAHKVAILNIGDAVKKTGTGIDADNLGKLTDTNETLKLSSSGTGIAFTVSSDKTTSPVFANSLLMTNKYYSLFNNDSNLKVMGKYGEEINMESAKIADNYILSVSDSECAKVEMAGGGKNTDPAYVYFDECAAGKSIDVIISVKGNEEVKNTITFTNIVKAVENTKLIVSLDVGTEKYNVVNNDVVIKIRGDGQTSGFNKAVITAKSDNSEATVKLMPVKDLFGKEFGSNLNSRSQLLDVISAEGNYYVVSSDKEGMIAITVTDSIPAAKAKGGVEVLLKGELSFKMTAIDLAAPTATSVAVPSGIITTISDAHLNTEATKVSIWNIQGDKITDVVMGDSGVYTAKLSQGSYQVRISAVDLGGNVYNKFFLRTVGEQSGPSIESLLIANGSYKVSGIFVSHDFKSKNPNHNWAYTDAAGTTYQLLGNEPDSESPFGWKKTDAKVSTSSDWFMIKLEGTVGNADAKGRFGWILVNKAGDTYKLKGVKAEDNTFEFSSALHLNAKVDGSNVTFTAK